MRLQVEFHRRLLAKIVPAVVSTLLVVVASSAGATRPLATQQLRAQPISSSASPLGFSLRPRTMPLRVPNAKAYAAAKAAAERGYQTWAARHPQTGSSPLAPRSSTPATPRPQAVLFEGLDQSGMFGGGLNTSVTPPDTTGAIGPNDYVEMVNSEITVYNRSTLSVVNSMSEDNFTGKSSTCDGQIRWDQQAERWEYASLDCGLTGTEGFSFGWSKTADPTDLSSVGWCKYRVGTEKTLFDYPKLGGDDDFLMIGFNAFEEEVKPAEIYAGSGVITIPKPAKGRSTCPSGSEITLGVEPLPVFTPVPANIYGSSATGYVVAGETPASETGSAKTIDVFTMTKNGEGKPEFHQPPPVSVTPYFFPAGVPQPGTTDTIDSSDTRLTQAVAVEDPSTHQIQVWTQHTVATTFGLPSVVAWYELKAGSSTPVQEGTIEGSLGNFAFNGAISPTARGNGAAIDYNIGGPTLAAELHAQSRAPITAAGEMEADVKLAESEASDKDFSCPSVTAESAPCRWGDYAGASPDPVHPDVVWGTGEVNGPEEAKKENGAQWKTENFALTLRAQKPTAAFSVTTPAPTGGSPVGFDASASSDPVEEIAAYEWSYGDGTTGSGEKPSHVFARPGKYMVKLTVMDNGGLTAGVEHEVTVADAPPVASFAAPSPTAGVPIAFDGSPSKDPDGTIASYAWSFGDGSSPSGEASPFHTFAAAGQYAVKLTVTDDGGLARSMEHTIIVAPASLPLVQSIAKEAPFKPAPFAVIAVRQNKKTGTVTLTLQIPGAGRLQISDSKAAKKARRGHKRPQALVKPLRMTLTQAGIINVQLLPSAVASRLLGHKHAVPVRALIVFTPTGGKAVGLTKSLVLKKTAKRRK
jgi:PKD repeat protein